MVVTMLGWSSLAGPAAGADTAVELRESLAAGSCTQVRIELKAEGLFRPGLPPGDVTAEAKLPKPLALDVKSRLVFSERLLKADCDGAGKAGGEATRLKGAAVGPSGGLRDQRRGAGRRPACSGPSFPCWWPSALADGTVVVVSPAGPMTRSELELVQGLGDPLILVDLLPRGPVSKGESWKLPNSAVFALTDYDELKSSTL